MTKYQHNTLLNVSTSCTKDVAIAKLLGKEMRYLDRNNAFQQDSLRQKRPEYLNEVGIPIFKELKDQRDAAQRELDEAIASGQQIYIDDCKLQLSRLDDLIRRAHRYSCDIADEFSKENSSMLRVDKYATKTLSNPHITLNSLDQWARQKYQVSILESDTDVAAILATKSRPEQPDEQFPMLVGLGPASTPVGDSARLKQDSAAVTPQSNWFEVRNAKKGMTRASADSLYLTMAFLIELFLETTPSENFPEKVGRRVVPDLFKKNGELNVKAFALYLEEVVAKANGGALFPSQGWESMKTKIEEAERVKRQFFTPK